MSKGKNIETIYLDDEDEGEDKGEGVIFRYFSFRHLYFRHFYFRHFSFDQRLEDPRKCQDLDFMYPENYNHQLA